MTFGEKIYKLRVEKNMTQDELATAVGYKSRSTIAKIESGERDPHQSMIVKLAKALNTTPTYLMGWGPNIKQHPLFDTNAKNSKQEDNVQHENKKPNNESLSGSEYNIVKFSSNSNKINPFNNKVNDKLYVLEQKTKIVPIYGSVSAGFGSSAKDYIIDYIPLYIESESEAENTICIKVVGNSMSPKIEDGDIIQVHKQSDVDNGSVAVVMIDGEDFVVKRFYHEENKVTLESFNEKYEDRVFIGKEMSRIQIVGLVRSVIKKL